MYLVVVTTEQLQKNGMQLWELINEETINLEALLVHKEIHTFYVCTHYRRLHIIKLMYCVCLSFSSQTQIIVYSQENSTPQETTPRKHPNNHSE